MMILPLLVIDTSTRWAGIGLKSSDGKTFGKTWRSDQNHGTELMVAIKALVEEADVRLSQLSGIGVAVGPGGFTAVRVGISTAIGLAMPNNLPIAALPTHCIEAQPYLDGISRERPLYSLLPCGRDTVSWAKFISSDVIITPSDTGLSTPDDLTSLLEPQAKVCGEGAHMLQGDFRADRVSPEPPTRFPDALIQVAEMVFASGQASPEPPVPIYARPPTITKPKSTKYGVR